MDGWKSEVDISGFDLWPILDRIKHRPELSGRDVVAALCWTGSKPLKPLISGFQAPSINSISLALAFLLSISRTCGSFVSISFFYWQMVLVLRSTYYCNVWSTPLRPNTTRFKSTCCTLCRHWNTSSVSWTTRIQLVNPYYFWSIRQLVRRSTISPLWPNILYKKSLQVKLTVQMCRQRIQPPSVAMAL